MYKLVKTSKKQELLEFYIMFYFWNFALCFIVSKNACGVFNRRTNSLLTELGTTKRKWTRFFPESNLQIFKSWIIDFDYKFSHESAHGPFLNRVVENLSRRGTTTLTQSSTYKTNKASLANDGNKTTTEIYCAHTAPNHTKAWFQVDLGKPYSINSVKIYYRKEGRHHYTHE